MLNITYASHTFHSFHETPETRSPVHSEEGDETTGHSTFHPIISNHSDHGDYLPNTDGDGGISAIITIVIVLVTIGITWWRNRKGN